MEIEFTIPGEPQGKGRPRFGRMGNRVVTRTPEKTAVYENLVKTQFYSQCGQCRFPDDAMLDVRISAYYGMPKSVSQRKRRAMLAHEIRPTKKPDFDNIGKVVCDSLNGLAYRDDAQIVDSRICKYYCTNPRVVVTIREADTLFKEAEQRVIQEEL